ncbi:hypothetical protein HJC23_003382 [Cyclotella cryptica]|uniref:U-box domain-containing protein n=1 Tax=Cyclotella cryptica TaxID=29204 RepID=A0ABD3QYT3_9STRA|eukprot:CCRYP_000966-RA/>CCRYP_000966-RA protein AED:0.41 eAED:0.41 QI:495/1/1/1/1/1/2/162/521
MLKLHPDKQPAGQSEEEAAEISQKFHDVMDAKSFLLDSEHMSAKRAYDSKLASLERQRQQKLNIPTFDNSSRPNMGPSKGSMFQKENRRATRRGSDCTNDRRPHFFKNSDDTRRASCDDCSTTSQSTSGDDNNVRSNKLNNNKQENSGKKHSGSRDTFNAKSSRHQRQGSMTHARKPCKKASSFSESYSSFFTVNDPKKVDSKSDAKGHTRMHSMDHTRPFLNGKSDKPTSPSNTKPRVSISSSATSRTRSSSIPDAHSHAKQRITNSIEALAKTFTCPLTHEIIKDPMTDFEGNNYEREAILKYLDTHSTSPVTGSPLYVCHLTANSALKEKIRYTMELKKTFDLLHEAETKEIKNATKHHSSSHPASKGSSKRLRDLIDDFINELNAGSPAISMSTLDNYGTTSFSYLGIKFKLEVSEAKSFTVQTIFDQNKKAASISSRLVDWNKALQEVGLGGKLTFRNVNGKFTFTLSKNMEPEDFKPRVFRYSIEYFLEFAIKLHNIINIHDLKTVGKVRLSASG